MRLNTDTKILLLQWKSLRNDGVVTIAVRNAGDPISKEVLEQLFARFYLRRSIPF